MLTDEFDVQSEWVMRLFSFALLQRARSTEINTDARTDKAEVAECSIPPDSYIENL